MKTMLLLLSVCLFSACATSVPRSAPAEPEIAGTPSVDSVDASDRGRRDGRRAALWTGIGFALYAIYEANNNDDYVAPQAEPSRKFCLIPGQSVKCW